jgi:hypothetical protein
MGFPIFYQGKILFRQGKPAFSVNCCCEPSPCVEDCGIFINGNHLDVRTLRLKIGSFDDSALRGGTSAVAVDPLGEIEYLGNCEFRQLFSVVYGDLPSPVPELHYMYGSVRNNIWQFDLVEFSFTGSLEEYPPNGGYYIITNGTQITRFEPTMDPCEF